MKSFNTKKNKEALSNKIEEAGINLSEFNYEQKKQIMEAYAMVCYEEGLFE